MHTTHIVIIGAGFSGIGMAIRLRRAGISAFVILERASAPGGTWRDNTYPGCSCDVQSALYSFSFFPNPAWSRTFAPQAEIQGYLTRCATAFDIDRHFRFAQTVTGATWDDTTQRWTVTTENDSWSANVVVHAGGALSDPVLPAIPGLESFGGESFHSARWRHDIDLTNRRVTVIGTGASAIQFVPQIQPIVAHLTVHQRTAPWILPRKDAPAARWRQAVHRALPGTQRLQRAAQYAERELLHLPFTNHSAGRLVEWLARRHLNAQVRDPALRQALRPDYRVGCKRILISDDYYPAVQQPNFSLVTMPISHASAAGITTADGVLHRTDVIVFGTGFRPTDPALAPAILGRNGASLAQAWQGSPTAYLGTTVPGFPNFFMLLGPNTGLGHNSVLLMAEAQMDHVLGVLSLMRSQHAGAAEPQPDVLRRYVASIDARLALTAWNTGGCNSWYFDRTGRNSALWPDGVGRFVRAVSRVNAADYLLAPAHDIAIDRARSADAAR